MGHDTSWAFRVSLTEYSRCSTFVTTLQANRQRVPFAQTPKRLMYLLLMRTCSEYVTRNALMNELS